MLPTMFDFEVVALLVGTIWGHTLQLDVFHCPDPLLLGEVNLEEVATVTQVSCSPVYDSRYFGYHFSLSVALL